MAIIHMTTLINASIDRCFDLARDVDFHQLSMAQTHERAIAGRCSGLCELGDTITWRAVHFGISQTMTVEITRFDKPNFFEDRMVKGAFASMRHEHHFKETNGTTTMTDRFEYRVPFGMAGRLFDAVILKSYMTRFLTIRNSMLKSIAEAQA